MMAYVGRDKQVLVAVAGVVVVAVVAVAAAAAVVAVDSRNYLP
jgi:hypothetical protein